MNFIIILNFLVGTYETITHKSVHFIGSFPKSGQLTFFLIVSTCLRNNKPLQLVDFAEWR